VAHEAVFVYREWATTKPMLQDWLARRVKNADENKKMFLEKIIQQYQDKFLILLKQKITAFLMNNSGLLIDFWVDE
jgi:hypothetical protein